MTAGGLVVGITGMPGSGKSFVAGLIGSAYGVVIDADLVAHELYSDPIVKKELIDHFGEAVIENGFVNRAYLAKIVFEEKKIKVLNKIFYSRVRVKMTKMLNEKSFKIGTYSVIDVPLLFESKMEALCSITICINADFKTRLNRVKSQRKWTENELRKRDSCQNEVLKRDNSDICLDGDVSFKTMVYEIKRLVIGIRYHCAMYLDENETSDSLKIFLEKSLGNSPLFEFN